MQVEDYGLVILLNNGKIYPLDDKHLKHALEEDSFYITKKGNKIVRIKYFSNNMFYLFKPHTSSNFRILYTKDLNVDFILRVPDL